MTVGYRPEIVQHAFIGLIGSHLHPFWSLTVPKLRLIAKEILDENLIALQFEMNYAFKRQAFDSKGGWQGGQQWLSLHPHQQQGCLQYLCRNHFRQ